MSRLRRLAPLALAGALLGAGCASVSEPESEWERQNARALVGPEERVAVPRFPRAADLIEIYVSAETDFKYFVDPASISVNVRERVVRYALVARSPSGVENVRFEAIRCPDEYRVLAVGRADGTWSGQPSEWRTITRLADRSWNFALSRRYFCPHRDPVRTVAEAVGALRNGVHPSVEVHRALGSD